MTEITASRGVWLRTRLAEPYRCLADRRYGPWFAAQILSSSGALTQSVVAAWLMYRMTHSATSLALLAACTMTPVLLGSAWAGGLADRVDRRRLLICTQVAFSAIGATLAAITSLLSPGLLLASAALTGSVLALDGPARQVYVLDIVGRERLASAVGLYEIVMNASRIIGPGLGGILLGAAGPSVAFATNAACFVPAVAVLIAHGRQAGPRVPVGRAATARGEAVSLLGGLRYAFGTPAIRQCLVIAGLSGILFNSTVLMPLLAEDSFRLGARGYGLLVAAFGVGALPGALLAVVGAARPTATIVMRLGLATGAAVMLTAWSPDAALAYASMAVVGFASIWLIATANTLVQLDARASMRGRVMGAWTMMLPGLSPITGLLVAVLVNLMNPRIVFAITGILIAIVAVERRSTATHARRMGYDRDN